MKYSDRPDPTAAQAAYEQLKAGVSRADYKPNRARHSYEQDWPADVWSIGLDRLDLLGVDERGNLHWNGAPIEIKRPLSLSVWQRVGAAMVVIATVVSAISAMISAYAAIHTTSQREQDEVIFHRLLKERHGKITAQEAADAAGNSAVRER